MDYRQEEVAADVLLGRGVRYQMPAPSFLRWFRKTIGFAVRKPLWGISIYTSKLYASTGIDPDKTNDLTRHEVLKLQADHGITFSKIIAAATLNNYFLLWLVKPFAAYIRANLSEEEAAMLIYWIVNFSATENFGIIIASAAATRVTSPPDASQKRKDGS